MQPISYAALCQDLKAWAAQDGQAIRQAASLRGGGAWESWCVVQFLRWQLTAGNRGDLDYSRENHVNDRFFDIAYNTESRNPLILTQWKCRLNSADISSKIHEDVGTLTEMNTWMQKQNTVWTPLLVALSPDGGDFGGAEVTALPGGFKLTLSTQETWRSYSGWKM